MCVYHDFRLSDEFWSELDMGNTSNIMATGLFLKSYDNGVVHWLMLPNLLKRCQGVSIRRDASEVHSDRFSNHLSTCGNHTRMVAEVNVFSCSRATVE